MRTISDSADLEAEKRKEEVLTLVYANTALLEGTSLGVAKAKSGESTLTTTTTTTTTMSSCYITST